MYFLFKNVALSKITVMNSKRFYQNYYAKFIPIKRDWYVGPQNVFQVTKTLNFMSYGVYPDNYIFNFMQVKKGLWSIEICQHTGCTVKVNVASNPPSCSILSFKQCHQISLSQFLLSIRISISAIPKNVLKISIKQYPAWPFCKF